MTDEIWDPRGEARRALAVAVEEHGPAVLKDPGRLDNLLRDLLPDSPREAALVVAAAQLNVARLIDDRVSAGVDPATAVRLSAAALERGRPFEVSACKWVSREFALALGLDVPTEPLPIVAAGDPSLSSASALGTAPSAVPTPSAGPAPAESAEQAPEDLPPTTAVPGIVSAPATALGTLPFPAAGALSGAGATDLYPPTTASPALGQPTAAQAGGPSSGYWPTPPTTGQAATPAPGEGQHSPGGRRRSLGVVVAVVAAVVVLGAGATAATLLSSHHGGHAAASSTAPSTTAPPGSMALGTSTTAPVASTTVAPPTTRATTTTVRKTPPPGLNQLAGFLAQSATARGDVGNATVGVEGCKESPAAAITQVKASIDLRQGVLGNLSSVNLTALSGGTALVGNLRSAMTYSVRADQDFLAWLNDVTRANAKRGHAQGPGACSQYTKDRNWMAGNNESVLANNAKMTFVAAWNPLATEYHLATYQADGF